MELGDELVFRRNELIFSRKRDFCRGVFRVLGVRFRVLRGSFRVWGGVFFALRLFISRVALNFCFGTFNYIVFNGAEQNGV